MCGREAFGNSTVGRIVNLVAKKSKRWYNLAMNDIKQTIADNLVGYRKKAGLTQQQLAEKLNYSDKAVSKWERAEAIPDVVVLKTIADIYGIKVHPPSVTSVHAAVRLLFRAGCREKGRRQQAFSRRTTLANQFAVRRLGVLGGDNRYGGVAACGRKCTRGKVRLPCSCTRFAYRGGGVQLRVGTYLANCA